MDVRAPAGRAQPGPHHQGAERRRDSLPVGGRLCPQHPPPGQAWTLTTIRAILANPCYTGRQVWNRQPTRYELIDPANTRLAHRQVQRWGLPDGWIISACPSHRALVSEEEFIAVQGIRAERGTGTAEGRRYLLAGLLRCGTCGRRMESCWANSRPAYRYGYSSASKPDHARLGNLYIREDDILPHLPGLLVRTEPAPRTRRRTRRGVDIRRPASEQAAVAGRLASLQLKCRADAWQPTGRFSLHPRALAA